MLIARKRLSTLNREDGSVAVEFAMIIVPFVYLTIAIIELAMMTAASNMLEAAVNESSRSIRTGQIQEQTALPPQEAFEEELCSHLFVIVDCDEVSFEVISMPGDSFSEAAAYQPVYDEDGNLVPRDFDAGSSNDVVMIRATFRYQLMTPLFSRIFSQEPDQTIPMISTVVIETEPYDFDDSEET